MSGSLHKYLSIIESDGEEDELDSNEEEFSNASDNISPRFLKWHVPKDEEEVGRLHEETESSL
jgi:hypothetical protein